VRVDVEDVGLRHDRAGYRPPLVYLFVDRDSWERYAA
jgi:hypothetical protein